MNAQMIDGNALAKKLRAEFRSQAAQLTAQGQQPGLAVILVGDDPASQVYVRNKVKACEDAGFLSRLERLPASTTEAELLAHIEVLNQDALIHGILVQLPVPKHINEQKVIEAISPAKDVDGFHVSSAGALMVGMEGFKPCTPYGCMKMIESIGYDLRGKHAVVLGRSNIVGKPMAMLLLAADATVTICHSKTANLKAVLQSADVVIAAVGRPNMVTGDMLKPGAVVIDVGINRYPDGHALAGKLCGDVDFESAAKVAGYISPVPGGVGPMTITMLLGNTLIAAQRRLVA